MINPTYEEEQLVADVEEKVVLKLIRYISDNGLRNDDRLPSIRQLADKWSLTHSQVRSGVLRASALGIVRMVPRSGIYVREFDLSHFIETLVVLFEAGFRGNRPPLLDLYDLKTVLEVGMFRRTAEIRTDEDVFELKQLLNQMESAKTRLKKIEFDEQFHLNVARMSRNRLYEPVLAAIQAMLRTGRLAEDFYEHDFANIMKDHYRLYEAINARDGDRAASLAATHSDRRKRRLMESL